MGDHQIFSKGDICICKFKLRSGKGKSLRYKKDCRVRIIRKVDINGHRIVYSVYNLDFKRYENIGSLYLEYDLSSNRDKKIMDILK
jgi:hypothetical protein